ncbi:hypothetical protein BABINDRAFT_160513 [Babjeviella inositovora NRRL Y-12698]|uniref:Precorrin-2 dehydrogenase n=1 Tax=Babjeviella inositovora NRRL Y-12698 TaxID=984486 RepID=A0A1E3QVW3_9ASCO|nr:uncharacterized protein BABINDRAFT_160513 [Babjeviella inositovora NRRL Y-12698]ODQ81107.1 hypothetical protein BABINDRAFT_160513 [Babjeviella inositovora NRRL Y-12698]
MSNILASWHCQNETHLVVGISNLTATRAQSILNSGATAVIVSNDPSRTFETLPLSLQTLLSDPQLRYVNKAFEIADLTTLGRVEVAHVVDKVFVVLSNVPVENKALKQLVYQTCCRLRIPINTADSSELCSFTLLSSYKNGDFQMGVTTSGKGCRLANRIKRELINALPGNIGDICNKVGELRVSIQQEDARSLDLLKKQYEQDVGENDDDAVQTSRFNTFISEFTMSENDRRLSRSRWLAQVVEYYPLKQLSELSIEYLTGVYQKTTPTEGGVFAQTTSQVKSSSGSISLIGAGPGSLSLLTLGALNAIHTADLVLADKLVPQQVLDLIPRHTETFIARKFPGNAEAAQNELLELGLSAAKAGKAVVRLKQGDPYIFGRGGEEYLYFQQNGFTPQVLAGISSALSAQTVANIPATQRDVADQVLICTGTGRRGALPVLPDFVDTRTTVFLMSLHRIVELIPQLIDQSHWPADVPAAIIERASCPDQRVTRTTLSEVANAVEAIGSRPPGLLVVGYACEVLEKLGEGERWRVDEGYEDGFESGILDFVGGIK